MSKYIPEFRAEVLLNVIRKNPTVFGLENHNLFSFFLDNNSRSYLIPPYGLSPEVFKNNLSYFDIVNYSKLNELTLTVSFSQLTEQQKTSILKNYLEASSCFLKCLILFAF